MEYQVIYDLQHYQLQFNTTFSNFIFYSGRGSVRLERTVRDREVGGSNPPAPTGKIPVDSIPFQKFNTL